MGLPLFLETEVHRSIHCIVNIQFRQALVRIPTAFLQFPSIPIVIVVHTSIIRAATCVVVVLVSVILPVNIIFIVQIILVIGPTIFFYI
jgi:hypothetical protein